ncbi:hypothetical protein [Glycomyces tenuis]|uniref:hypothetical protein n=1 Tax=Glycomyces tenuis TaxID=58116 RepID=UPI00047E8E2E|nr:hypothetical protein [Glycomyces tenuis]
MRLEDGGTITLVHLGIADAVDGGLVASGTGPAGERLVTMPRESGLGPLGRFALRDLDEPRRSQMQSVFEALARRDGQTGDDLVQALADTEGNAGALRRLEEQGAGSMPQEVAGRLRGWFSRSESGGPGVFTRSLNVANMIVGLITDGGFATGVAAGIEHDFTGAPPAAEAPYNPSTGAANVPGDPVLPGPISLPDPNDRTNYFEPNRNRLPGPEPRQGTGPDGDSGKRS